MAGAHPSHPNLSLAVHQDSPVLLLGDNATHGANVGIFQFLGAESRLATLMILGSTQQQVAHPQHGTIGGAELLGGPVHYRPLPQENSEVFGTEVLGEATEVTARHHATI